MSRRKGCRSIKDKEKQTKATVLFADTKLTKYIIQLIFIRNLTRNLSQKMEAAANVGGEQVAGQLIIEAFADIEQGLCYLLQRMVVAGIGNNRSAVFGFTV